MNRERSLRVVCKTFALWARVHALPLFLIGIGTYFRLRKFLFNRSLWLDEARIALNVLDRPFTGFFQPLSYNQAAPPAFMMLEKLAVQLLGGSEYVLRLVPLTSSLLSLILFYLLAKRILGQVGVTIAIALMAVAEPLIFYASEVKQYSSDILCTILLFWIIDRNFQRGLSRREALAYAIIGSLLIWLSFPAVFILTGAALCRIAFALIDRKPHVLRERFPVYVVWGGSFVLFYWIIRDTAANQALIDFWQGSFMPVFPLRFSLLEWLIDAYIRLFRDVLDLTNYSGATALFLVGFFSMLSNHRNRAAILSAPIFVTLAASSIQAYPFKHRLIIFMAPSIALFLAQGFYFVWKNVGRSSWILGILLASLLLYQPSRSAVSTARVPKGREEMRPIMARLSENIQEGDEIYLYYNAQYAFRYYQERYGLVAVDTVIGIEAREQPSKYLDDLKPLYGNPRVWFVFSHGYNEGPEGDEWAYFLKALDCRGQRIDRWKSTGAALYLYDLSLEAAREAQRSNPQCR